MLLKSTQDIQDDLSDMVELSLNDIASTMRDTGYHIHVDIVMQGGTRLIAGRVRAVKVTLDEYIEISKYYSTPGSSTFINGVLDKIVA